VRTQNNNIKHVTEMTFKGHSRPPEMSRFDRAYFLLFTVPYNYGPPVAHLATHWSKSAIFTARCICISAVFPVTRCPSVCLSVTFRSWAKTNKDIFESFSPSGSDTILVFPHQRGCRYSDGNPPNGGIECKGVRWAHAARQFVSIEFSFHPYNI